MRAWYVIVLGFLLIPQLMYTMPPKKVRKTQQQQSVHEESIFECQIDSCNQGFSNWQFLASHVLKDHLALQLLEIGTLVQSGNSTQSLIYRSCNEKFRKCPWRRCKRSKGSQEQAIRHLIRHACLARNSPSSSSTHNYASAQSSDPEYIESVEFDALSCTTESDFTGRLTLQKQSVHEESIFECQIGSCNQGFSNWQLLASHVLRNHLALQLLEIGRLVQSGNSTQSRRYRSDNEKFRECPWMGCPDFKGSQEEAIRHLIKHAYPARNSPSSSTHNDASAQSSDPEYTESVAFNASKNYFSCTTENDSTGYVNPLDVQQPLNFGRGRRERRDKEPASYTTPLLPLRRLPYSLDDLSDKSPEA